ncbi:hypothetical protein R9C00_21465 [Flammeovirgaceae bacterium SG7u.111]|nr:hypothetical protein [Flammeovirgaceae bacterium SG7u.132]WPO34271.1 hypothetical protein R9C00_21465 [Flammeovirgaceae bacterium SG7u.111]
MANGRRISISIDNAEKAETLKAIICNTEKVNLAGKSGRGRRK